MPASSVANNQAPRRVTLADVKVIVDPYDAAELVSPRDAAKLMGVQRRIVYEWIRMGKVKIRVTAGGRMLVEVKTLMRRTQERR